MKSCTQFGRLVFALALAAMALFGNTAHAGSRKFRTLYTFTGGDDGYNPTVPPAVDKNGNLYGPVLDGGPDDHGLVYELAAPKTRDGAWKKTVIYSFTDGKDGVGPVLLLRAADGILYGVCDGANEIFQLTPPKHRGARWQIRSLYTLNNGSEGSAIQGMTLGSDGNLYGATELGGLNDCGEQSGCGLVFELQHPQTKNGAWTYQLLYAFTGYPDGFTPYAGVTLDQEGNVYGTTGGGGNYDRGTVYELTPPKNGGNWTESIIYSFDENGDDGNIPGAAVTFDSSGNLYGTTAFGGSPNCGGGCGVVYELSVPNWTYSTLYAFQGGVEDGNYPVGAVVFDSEGDLYGTTSEGGGNQNYSGIVFQLTPPPGGGSWTETVLHRFKAGQQAGPTNGLTWGKWGDLYGTGYGTGKYYAGTVFALSP